MERRMEKIKELSFFCSANPYELKRLNEIYSQLATSKKMLNWFYISKLPFMKLELEGEDKSK